MRNASILIFAAFATLLSSCGDDQSPTQPKKEYYCNGNYKTYTSLTDFFNECPDQWCEYTGTLMSHAYYNNGGCKPQVSVPNSSSSAIVSSSSKPRSSSSSRPRSSSSVDVCPTKKCDCTPGFDKIYKEVMGEYTASGMAHSSFAKEEAAKRAGCIL